MTETRHRHDFSGAELHSGNHHRGISFLGREPVNRFGGVDWKKIRQDTIKLLQAEGASHDPTTQLKDLSVSDIQVLEILKVSLRKRGHHYHGRTHLSDQRAGSR